MGKYKPRVRLFHPIIGHMEIGEVVEVPDDIAKAFGDDLEKVGTPKAKATSKKVAPKKAEADTAVE